MSSAKGTRGRARGEERGERRWLRACGEQTSGRHFIRGWQQRSCQRSGVVCRRCGREILPYWTTGDNISAPGRPARLRNALLARWRYQDEVAESRREEHEDEEGRLAAGAQQSKADRSVSVAAETENARGVEEGDLFCPGHAKAKTLNGREERHIWAQKWARWGGRRGVDGEAIVGEGKDN